MTYDWPFEFPLFLAPLVYLPSVILVTMLGNVPMNEALARLDHDSLDARIYWEKDTRIWTMLNETSGIVVASRTGSRAV